MKDLFETLIGFEEQKIGRTKKTRPQRRDRFEGEVLRDLMGGEGDMGSYMDVEAHIERGGKSSILEDFDYDRDFEEATLDTDATESSDELGDE